MSSKHSSHSDQKDYHKHKFDVQRLQFWTWEYGRRSTEKNRQLFNEYWAENYDNSIRDSNDLIVYRFEPPLGDIYFNCREAGYRATRGYRNSQDMVEDYIQGCFKHKSPNLSGVSVSGLNWLSLTISSKEAESTIDSVSQEHGITGSQLIEIIESVITGLKKNLDYACLAIPRAKSADIIAENIKGLMHLFKYEDSLQYRGDDEIDKLRLGFKSIFSAQKREYLEEGGMKRLPPKSSTPRRILGLWLWDYIQEHECTQKVAIHALGQDVLEDMELGNVEPSDLRFFYRRTKECIEQGKILSFSKKGT